MFKLIQGLFVAFSMLVATTQGQLPGSNIRDARPRFFPRQNTEEVNAIPNVKPGVNQKDDTYWTISIVDHPQLVEKYGDVNLSGKTENMRSFFRNHRLELQPDSPTDSRTIDSFFDVFTESQALSVDITLHCSCCPLKCKLTISIKW